MYVLLLPRLVSNPFGHCNRIIFAGRVDPAANHHDRSGIARHVGLRLFGATITKNMSAPQHRHPHRDPATFLQIRHALSL